MRRSTATAAEHSAPAFAGAVAEAGVEGEHANGTPPVATNADRSATTALARPDEQKPFDVGHEVGRTALAQLLMCRQLAQKRQYARALRELDLMLADDPALGVAHFLRSLVFGASGNLPAAKAALADAVTTGYTRTIVWLLLGHIEIELQNLQAALSCAEKALTADPHNAAAYELRASAYARLHDHLPAAAAYEAAVQHHPQSRPLRLRWALQLQRAGEPVRAEQVVLSALRLNPFDLHSRLNLGNLLWALQQFDGAIAEFRAVQAMKLDTNSRPQAALGKLYLQLGRHDEAEQVLREAVRINPKDFDSYVALGELYLAQGNAPAAREALTSAVKVDRSVVAVRDLLASIDAPPTSPAPAAEVPPS